MKGPPPAARPCDRRLLHGGLCARWLAVKYDRSGNGVCSVCRRFRLQWTGSGAQAPGNPFEGRVEEP
jgi:hypothetical protein